MMSWAGIRESDSRRYNVTQHGSLQIHTVEHGIVINLVKVNLHLQIYVNTYELHLISSCNFDSIYFREFNFNKSW